MSMSQAMYIPIQVDKMSPQLVSNRKIRPEGERLACSEHQPFQKKKGEGARSGNLLFMFFIGYHVTASLSFTIPQRLINLLVPLFATSLWTAKPTFRRE